MSNRFPLLSLLVIGMLFLLVEGCSVFGIAIAAAIPEQEEAPAAAVDLDVTYINRTPLYHAYCVQYLNDAPNQPGRPMLCPGTEADRRWPKPGEIVTFTAHIINKGSQASPAANYTWLVDGVAMSSGTLPALAASAGATAVYQWPWGHGLSADGQRALGEHTIAFAVDSDHQIVESFESNNILADDTQAMSFNIAITPEMYAAYNVPVDAGLPASAEDWLQKQITAMNDSFAHAVYTATTPAGSALRVRINNLSIADSHPDGDGMHDGGWFVNADYRHGASDYYDPATDIDWGLVHEWSHQVALIDLYAIGVYASNVFVTDHTGIPANFEFGWANGGLMFGGSTAPYYNGHMYESHTAGGSNTFAGYRNGFYGAYLFDIPQQNYLRILDNTGSPAAGVQVAVYQRAGPNDWTGQMGVDNTPEITGTTDANGVFAFPNRSANGGAALPNGHVLHDNPFGVVDIVGNQGLLLVNLYQPTSRHEEFFWLDITQFNLAYWAGDVLSHTFTISSHIPAAGAPQAPTLGSVFNEARRITFEWASPAAPGITGYRVYRAMPPDYQYVLASGLLTTTHFSERFDELDYNGLPRLYAVTSLAASGQESGFSKIVYAPRIDHMADVSISPEGETWILTHSFYPLLVQTSSGRYTRNPASVHYDLSAAHSLAFDSNGNLLVSGMGNFPDPENPGNIIRRAVRLYDREMRPLLAFGPQGSGPGEFTAASGIAFWGPACTYGGPYTADEQTTLLLHFDGDFTGAQGEPGTANGAQLAPGRHGQGLLLDETDTLTYTAASNLDLSQGSIEFWLLPNWDGSDGQNYTFFQAGAEWEHSLKITKDGGNNLRFIVWDGAHESGLVYNVSHWRKVEWRHVAATWQGTTIELYVDGALVASNPAAYLPTTLAEQLYIGSSSFPDQQAHAIIDELRISSLPRLGNSNACGGFLVTDSEQDRIQAFDHKGNFIAQYGSSGSGSGQFDAPRGIAIDPSGRVILVDQVNNRLVALAFDGQTFTELRLFTAGFSSPRDVAVDSQGNLYVADAWNNRIAVLDPVGHLIAQFHAPNDGYTGSFDSPQGVAITPDGRIIVADTYNQRVVSILGFQPSRLYLPMLRR